MSRLKIGTGIAAAVALLGLAGSLSNYKNETLARIVVIVASAVFVVCGMASLIRYVRARYDRAVQSRVEQVVSAKLAELPVPKAPQPEVRPEPIPVQASFITHAADLKAAVNHVIGELEDVAEHMRADDHSYWSRHYLPTFEWDRHSDLIAREDDRAYQATRTAYREIDRVERCMKEQRISYDMGDVWLPDDATVERCRPKGALIAITDARSKLRKLLRDDR